MTEFERRYPGVAMKAKCPKCGKSGKSIRTREDVNGLHYCCGKCGETWNKSDAENAEYFGIPIEWMPEHNRLIETKICDWPQSLKDFVKKVCDQVGMCGDVIACVIADWIKQEKVRI